jgi:hypothetical protein
MFPAVAVAGAAQQHVETTCDSQVGASMPRHCFEVIWLMSVNGVAGNHGYEVRG